MASSPHVWSSYHFIASVLFAYNMSPAPPSHTHTPPRHTSLGAPEQVLMAERWCVTPQGTSARLYRLMWRLFMTATTLRCYRASVYSREHLVCQWVSNNDDDGGGGGCGGGGGATGDISRPRCLRGQLNSRSWHTAQIHLLSSTNLPVPSIQSSLFKFKSLTLVVAYFWESSI